MALIGRTGGIAYTDPVVLSIPREDVALFYRNPDARDFSWGRFMGFPLERPQTGRVVPEFFHLFPAFGAYLFQAMGVKGALATPPVFGVLGTLGVFFVFRRLFGPAAALLGALLLAVNVVQVWFARYPVSEAFSQFLIFLGVLALAHWEERGAPPSALLAGAAFGLSLLVRIDSVLVLVPLGLYLLAAPGPRRPALGSRRCSSPARPRPRPARRAPRLLFSQQVRARHRAAGRTGAARPGSGCWSAAAGRLLVLLAHRYGPRSAAPAGGPPARRCARR